MFHVTDRFALPTRAPNRGISAAILVAGLALNAYTLHSALQVERVREKPALTLITDPAELVKWRHDVVGTFATGSAAGDRRLVVTAEGRITFSEMGSKTGIADGADAYRLARRGSRTCLATTDSGIIEVLNFETMVYYGDTYRRR